MLGSRGWALRDDGGLWERVKSRKSEGRDELLPPNTPTPVPQRHKPITNEKGHPPHPKARAHPQTLGALNHTNDDHYSLELKGAVEVVSVIPFTRICPPRMAKPRALKHMPQLH